MGQGVVSPVQERKKKPLTVILQTATKKGAYVGFLGVWSDTDPKKGPGGTLTEAFVGSSLKL